MRHTAPFFDRGRRHDADTQCEAGRPDHVDGATGSGCGGAGRVGPADGPAPLPGVPGHGGRRVAARGRDPGRDLGGVAGLVRRGVQGHGAGYVDRLGAGVAVPALAPGGEQLPVCGVAAGAAAEPGLEGVVVAPVIPGHGSGLRSSGVAGGDFCGPVPVQGELLPGGQLARVG